MNEEELYPDESRSLEDLRHPRLIALLGDMIDGHGKVKAAAGERRVRGLVQGRGGGAAA